MKDLIIGYTKALVLVIMLSISVAPEKADVLPDKPEPVVSSKFENREFLIETVGLGVAFSLDTVSTHQAFTQNPHAYEVGGLFNGSRCTPKIMGAWAAVDIGAVIVSYEWKHRVHNRYLHPLWRVPLLVRTEGHASAAAGNWM